MDFIFAIIVFTLSLIYSIFNQITILIPLIIGMISFSLTALHRGHKFKSIIEMLLRGMKRSLSLMPIFTLIGLITALWRASGTIPYFVYYGTKIMHPDFFILFAFLLTSFVSFALGTSFGTAGTIGVVLIILAKSGGVNIYITAGAIISGAYFGDRCSPVSSSANLVAIITRTDLYDNIKEMFITGALPFGVTVIIYLFLSKGNPIKVTDSNLIDEFSVYFNLHIATILPALVIFLLAAMKKSVKVSMLVSVVTAVVISYFYQDLTLIEITKSMIFGYELIGHTELSAIISGGGLISMVSVIFIVLIASSYSGIFEKTGMLNDIQLLLVKMSDKLGVYITTIFTSMVTCAFCCNQTLSTLLTYDLMHSIYEEKGLTKEHIAIDLENTVILIAAIFPWSIAIAVPLATMDVSAKAIPYAFYLFLVPLLANVRLAFTKKRTK